MRFVADEVSLRRCTFGAASTAAGTLRAIFLQNYCTSPHFLMWYRNNSSISPQRTCQVTSKNRPLSDTFRQNRKFMIHAMEAFLDAEDCCTYVHLLWMVAEEAERALAFYREQGFVVFEKCKVVKECEATCDSMWSYAEE